MLVVSVLMVDLKINSGSWLYLTPRQTLMVISRLYGGPKKLTGVLTVISIYDGIKNSSTAGKHSQVFWYHSLEAL